MKIVSRKQGGVALTLSLALMGLSACVTPVGGPATTPAPVTTGSPAQTNGVGVAQFSQVVATVEPVAERECRARTQGANCDFKILVERDPRAPANAWQSVDNTGRPTLTFTVALIADLKNTDELAFIMGHEAGHHIAGHLAKTQQTAVAGAVIGSILATVAGADAQGIQSAQEIGATVGARRYSKDFELEADQLGTLIAYRSGYNPVRGAEYFTRIPDPGDQFLGTHPPNGQRMETVRRTMATL